ATTTWSFVTLLRKLNPILRGWAHFYRYCTGAKDVFSSLDWYVRDRLWRWLRKKYPKANAASLLSYRRLSRAHRNCKVWQADGCEQLSDGVAFGAALSPRMDGTN